MQTTPPKDSVQSSLRAETTGAESLVKTLVAGGVDVCFANPGTSEMHFVSALDRVPAMRCILALFEGVATGAADGYARMLGRPAATLLHLGPGLANGLSNLHNARRARSPIVNVIGEHATQHRKLDAPLTSDIEGAARPFSDWLRTSQSADSVAADGAAAIAASRACGGQVASLILPADTAWTPLSTQAMTRYPQGIAPMPADAALARPDAARIEAAADLLRAGGPVAIILSGAATREPAIHLAGRIAMVTGADLLAPTQCPVIARGAGRPVVQRIPYPVDQARAALAGYRSILLVGAAAPVSFFAYPGEPGELAPPTAQVLRVCAAEEDAAWTLEALCDRLCCAGVAPNVASFRAAEAPSGPITPEGIGQALAATIPENAIIIDESISTGRGFLAATCHAQPHDWILGTGGAIGFALPNAIGAAVACPDRKVICLESDGSAMYMPQSLWTMSRENLPILVLIFANRRYQILRGEMANVGAQIGPTAASLLDIDRPTINWAGLADSLSVASERVSSLDALVRAMGRGLSSRGPYLVEIVL